MNFGLAFSYVFKDPDWFKKVAIAGAILLIPILGQMVVLGWALNITKRVINRDPVTLPNVDFGSDLGRGFSAFIITFVYVLPIILFIFILGFISAGLTTQATSDAAGWGVAILSDCIGLFALVYGFVCALLLPAAYGTFVTKGSLSAAFNVGQVFGLVKKSIGAYLMVFLGMLLVGFIAPIGSIACFIGVFLTMAYSQAVMGHLYGQAYNEASNNLAYIPGE